MRNRAWVLNSKRTTSELQGEAANRGLSTAGDKTTLLSAILDDITARATATAAATTATAATAATPAPAPAALAPAPAVVPVATAAEPVAVAAPATEHIGMNNWVIPGLIVAGIIIVSVFAFLLWNKGSSNDKSQPASNQTSATAPAATASATSTATSTQTTNGTNGVRQETGKGNTLPFPTDASVIGTTIKLSDGASYQGCSLAKASANGTVTDGVINPNQQELAAATPCVTMQVGNSQNGSTSSANGGSSSTLYGQPPQMYNPHPAYYVETGIVNVRTWTIPIDSDKVLIVGGVSVDNQTGGVYKEYGGGQTVTVTVTNGFASVVLAQWGQNEFCFRIGEAIKYGWAHSVEQPLPGTSCLPSSK